MQQGDTTDFEVDMSYSDEGDETDSERSHTPPPTPMGESRNREKPEDVQLVKP